MHIQWVISYSTYRAVYQYLVTCMHDFRSETHFTRLDWSLNGSTHSMGMGDVGMKYNHLFIQQPTIEDAGEYACSAIFPNYSSIPVSAGSLRFLREYLTCMILKMHGHGQAKGGKHACHFQHPPIVYTPAAPMALHSSLCGHEIFLHINLYTH